jgi:hypothetical protein
MRNRIFIFGASLALASAVLACGSGVGGGTHDAAGAAAGGSMPGAGGGTGGVAAGGSMTSRAGGAAAGGAMTRSGGSEAGGGGGTGGAATGGSTTGRGGSAGGVAAGGSTTGRGGSAGGAAAGGSTAAGRDGAAGADASDTGRADVADAGGADAADGSRAVAYDWVLTAFTNQSESNLYVYRSTDGRLFELVKGPAYTPPGAQLVRDPSAILHADGRYYLVYTTGWREKEFGIATSTDLRTWTFLVTVPTLANATSSWAPEWYVEDGAFHVIISISTTGNGSAFGTFTPYLFTATSADLKQWNGGVKLAGIAPNYIDTFVVRSGATYHAFTKNENTKLIEHATAAALGGPYTFVGTGDWAGWGTTAVEGPCLFPLADGTWRMLVDGYMTGEYLYSDSQDLQRWSRRQALPGGLSGFIRHGTVLRRVVDRPDAAR